MWHHTPTHHYMHCNFFFSFEWHQLPSTATFCNHVSFPASQIKKHKHGPPLNSCLNSTLQSACEPSLWEALPSPSPPTPLLQAREAFAASVPSSEDQSPLPDWSLRGKVWPIYFREVRGNHEAVHSGWPEGLAGSVRSWGWAVSKVSCLSGGGYGRGHNESRRGAGDGVAVGGGAKPSPASGVREEHQLYYLLLYSQ